MKIKYHKNFKKDYQKLQKKDQLRIDDTLRLFEDNPFNTILKNHALKGKLYGKRAISAGWDIRLVFREKNGYLEVLFLSVGSHNKVY